MFVTGDMSGGNAWFLFPGTGGGTHVCVDIETRHASVSSKTSAALPLRLLGNNEKRCDFWWTLSNH